MHRPQHPGAAFGYDRPETIEETAELVSAAGGIGIAVAVDHLEAGEVRALVQRIDAERERLDVLVNDIWGGELLFEWDTPVWEYDLEKGLRMLRPLHHLPKDHRPRAKLLLGRRHMHVQRVAGPLVSRPTVGDRLGDRRCTQEAATPRESPSFLRRQQR